MHGAFAPPPPPVLGCHQASHRSSYSCSSRCRLWVTGGRHHGALQLPHTSQIPTSGDLMLGSCLVDFLGHYCNDYSCDVPGVLQNTKTPQVWKYEKNTKKLQNHPFPVWPRKYEKITEKLQKWSFAGQFCNFSVFFFVFLGPNRKWVIL